MGNTCEAICDAEDQKDPINPNIISTQTKKEIELIQQSMKAIQSFNSQSIPPNIRNQIDSYNTKKEKICYSITYPFEGYVLHQKTQQAQKAFKTLNGYVNIYRFDSNQFCGCYLGYVKQGKACDKNAIYITKNGLQYQGQVQQNRANGNGSLIDKQIGYEYIGEWMDDLPHGKGVQKTPQHVYEGNFVQGKKKGSGNLKIGQEIQYEGQFSYDKFEGKGKLTINGVNGYVYEGDFKQGVKTGFGIWKGSGQSYEGFFANGKKSGRGKFTFENGDILDGQFLGDLPNGQGLLYQGKSVQKGFWQSGSCLYLIPS